MERLGFLGGAAVAGGSGTVCGTFLCSDTPEADGPRQTVFGFTEEFLQAMRARGGVTPPQLYGKTYLITHDPQVYKEVAEELVLGAGAGILYHTNIFGVIKEGDFFYGVVIDTKSGLAQIRAKGEEIIEKARAEGRRIIVLAGRPYHVDPEVNHGIDTLITRYGAAVITEDSISNRVEKFPTTVLNQWTYHSRLYAAAKYCTTQPDMDLVQLVSFGCGVDAITTDETREILQAGGKLYTQLKIDEITNLGAVNIRLRSLFAALDEKKLAQAAQPETR